MMNNIKDYLGNLFMFVIELVVGIILLINPIELTSAIIVICGILILCYGSINLFKYFKSDIKSVYNEQLLFSALICILLGAVCAFGSKFILSIFSMLTTLYGMIILVSGLKKIEWSIDFFRMGLSNWYMYGVSSLSTIIFAVIIICNPFITIELLWRFIGIILIIESILDLASIILIKNSVDNLDVVKIVEKEEE